MDKRSFSDKTYIYTFILGILVVLVHSVNFADSNTILLTMIQSSDFTHTDLKGLTGASAHIENFLSNALGQAAVPGFFMMSGYLFYRTLSNLKDIGRKWKERFWSLIIPFGAWNFIYYILYVCLGKAQPGLREIHDAITNYAYNPVFWYVYQLILLTVLAPIFYALLKNKFITIVAVVLYVIMVVKGLDIPEINEDAILYYFAGACLARHSRTIFEQNSKTKICIGALILLLVWALQIFTTVCMQMFLVAPIDTDVMDPILYWYYGGDITTALAAQLKTLPTGILVDILSVGGQVIVNVIRRLLLCLGLWFVLPDRLPEVKAYMKNGFFLYAVHYPIARIGIFVLEYMGVGYHGAMDQFIRLYIYLMIPVVCVAASYRLKLILKKCAPFMWRVLSGGR